MARLRMTYKNLKALRKTKEYQALLVDLVANNIVPKSVAENLLGYNIPANLIGSAEHGSGSGSGNDNPVVEPTNTVTLLYFDATANDGTGEWKTAEYDLDVNPGISEFAQDAFGDDTIENFAVVEEDPEYVEGESPINTKYVDLDPQPEEYEPGMLIKVWAGSDDPK